MSNILQAKTVSVPPDRKLKLLVPDGSLREPALTLFAEAGYVFTKPSRGYALGSSDSNVRPQLLRAQEIAPHVRNQSFDLGITGADWIHETGGGVLEIGEFRFSKQTSQPTKWVLAVPQESKLEKVNDVAGKIVATEIVNLVRIFLRFHQTRAHVEYSWGATESKPRTMCDAIVDVTETGSSLRANHLRVISELFQSTPRLIANESAYTDEWKKEKIQEIALALYAVMGAREMIKLEMNVPPNLLDQVRSILPAMKSPNIVPTADYNLVSVGTMVKKSETRMLIGKLHSIGVTDVIQLTPTGVNLAFLPEPKKMGGFEELFRTNKVVRDFRINQVKFKQDGIPCVVQDDTTDVVLMVSSMNREAFLETCRTSHATFWNPVTRSLITPGEKSGDTLIVREILLGNGGNSLLLKVNPKGSVGALGGRTTFGEENRGGYV